MEVIQLILLLGLAFCLGRMLFWLNRKSKLPGNASAMQYIRILNKISDLFVIATAIIFIYCIINSLIINF